MRKASAVISPTLARDIVDVYRLLQGHVAFASNTVGAFFDLVAKKMDGRVEKDFSEFLVESLGSENVEMAVYVMIGFGALSLLFFVRGLYYLFFFDPVARKYSSKSSSDSSAKHGSKKKSKKGGNHSAHEEGEDEAEVAAAAAARTAADEMKQEQELQAPTRRVRTRPLSSVEPTSTIKGFNRVGVLETSPCQQFLFISCRKSLKARMYPQNEKRLFMEKGKLLQDHHFVAFEDQIGDICRAKPDVSAIAFSRGAGDYVAIGESNTDSVYIFALNAGKKGNDALQLQWQYKLPNHGLACNLTNWCVGGHVGEMIIFAKEKDAVVTVVDKNVVARADKQIGSTPQKFKVGNASAWALAGMEVAVAGSYMKDARVAKITPRHDSSSFSLDKTFNLPDLGCRVTQMMIVAKGVPAHNTRHLIVLVMGDGRVFVFDLDVDHTIGRDAVLVASFADPDFDDDRCDGVLVAVHGHQYHERISIALWHQTDVAVWRQQDGFGSKKLGPAQLFTHVCDLHELHGSSSDDRVKFLTFVQHGNGLASCGDEDGLGIRLWTLPPME